MDSFQLVAVSIIFCLVAFFGLVAFIGAPYVPSQRKYIARMFDHIGLGKRDTLVDIGSGDGVVLRIAARYGAKAVGYEINPLLVGVSRLFSMSERLVQVRLQNAWAASLPDDVTVIYAFAVQRDEKKLLGLVQREANRLGRPLRLVCLGSPLRGVEVAETFDAYHLYVIQPLQTKNA